MNHTHTKGPWRSIQNFADEAEDERIFIEDKDGNTIAEITHGGLEWEEYEGNARLIASAPDLLAALKLVDSKINAYCELDRYTLEILEITRQAIAKATGN